MDIYKKRIGKVQGNLVSRGFQNTIVSDPASVEYLTGRHVSHVGERLLALLVSAEGKPVLFVNELFPIAPGEDFEIVYHNDTDTATAGLACYLPGGVVGIDRFLHAQFLIELMEARSDLLPRVGSFAVEEARMIKDLEEQQAMRRSSKICDAVFTKIPSFLREGMTEIELSKLFCEEFQRVGDPSASVDNLICFGTGAAEPHHTNSNAVLKSGDVVLVDAGQASFGYTSDMTRTFFYKSITDEQRNIYNIVLEANRRAREKAAPGVPFCEVDAAAREYISSFGYGKYFTHRTGHSIGLQVHEEPSVSAANPMPIQAGMTFSIEPGIYLPGRFGVRIEDLVLVTAEGRETLTAYTKEIQVIQ